MHVTATCSRSLLLSQVYCANRVKLRSFDQFAQSCSDDDDDENDSEIEKTMASGTVFIHELPGILTLDDDDDEDEKKAVRLLLESRARQRRCVISHIISELSHYRRFSSCVVSVLSLLFFLLLCHYLLRSP